MVLGLSVDPNISGGELQSLKVKITDINKDRDTDLRLGRTTREVRIPIRGDTFRPETTYAASFERGNASLIPGFSPLDRLRKQPLQAEQIRFITDLALGCLEQIVQENPSS